MIKALLKKQFLELAAFFKLSGAKNGKRPSKLGGVAIVLLMLYACVSSGFLFWETASMMCAPLMQGGLAWVYFALTGITSSGATCFVVVLASKNTLYEAKDNEALLSMPIPASVILFSRMIGLYLIALLLELLTFVPAVICYFTVAEFSVLALIFSVLIMLIMPFGTLAIACFFGWLLALLSAKLRSKNLITIVLLFAFILVYTLSVNKINEGLNYIIANGEAAAQTIKIFLFPFWQMGLGATGDVLGTVCFVGLSVAVFALVYWMLSVSFLSIATQNRAGKKAVYKEKEEKSRSVFFALIWKEVKRYLKNAMILFNSGIGSIIALIFAIFALFNAELCAQIVSSPVSKGEIAVILTTIVFFIASSNVITGTSISLEGDNLWLLRSMPVKTEEIFKAKIAFQIVYTLPVVLVQILICALLQIPFWTVVVSLLALCAVIVLCAAAGLAINLKLPSLKWTNEMVAVKQSLSTLVTMLVGWAIAGLSVGGHFLFGVYLPAEAYLAIVTAVFGLAAVVVLVWLKKRGVELFESL